MVKKRIVNKMARSVWVGALAAIPALAAPCVAPPPCDFGPDTVRFVGEVVSQQAGQVTLRVATPLLGISAGTTELAISAAGLEAGKRYIIDAARRNNRIAVDEECSGTAEFSATNALLRFHQTIASAPTSLRITGHFAQFSPEEDEIPVYVEGPTAREGKLDPEHPLALSKLDPGRYVVRVTRPGFVLGNGRVDTPVDVLPGSCRQVNLSLRGAQSISGTLRDGFSQPIPGVRIKLDARTEESQAATTDSKGHFRFTQVTPGLYWLSTGSDGFNEQFYPVVADQEEARSIFVEPGEDVENVEFFVPQPNQRRPVTVVVLNENGMPAARITVHLRPAYGPQNDGLEAQTDDQGIAHFDAFAESPYAVSATREGEAALLASAHVAPGATPAIETLRLRTGR